MRDAIVASPCLQGAEHSGTPSVATYPAAVEVFKDSCGARPHPIAFCRIPTASSLIFDAGLPLNPGGARQYLHKRHASEGVIELSENPTILVVEDEPLVAMVLESILEDMGALLVGPAASVEKALALIDAGGFAGALLDVNLRGERVDAVADALSAKGIPFVFTTGHGIDGIPPAHRDRPMLSKPFRDSDIVAALNIHVLAKQPIS